MNRQPDQHNRSYFCQNYITFAEFLEKHKLTGMEMYWICISDWKIAFIPKLDEIQH